MPRQKQLRPFFSYYGSKWRVAPKYPVPKFERVVEPFAGSAGYSLRYYTHNVELYDIDENVASVWDYLIHVPADEVRRLPVVVDRVSDLNVAHEAKLLIGFWLNHACTSPVQTPSLWMRRGQHKTSFWGEAIRERVASQVDAIRHWTITRASYTEIFDLGDATWFVDPPYDHASGRLYRAKLDDFQSLASWCRSLTGQVIVCEREGATWLPFRSFQVVKSTEGANGYGYSREAVWTNEENPP